jgi:prepilin-type N-terminal cleavage/methylation domain-containing protein
MRRRGITLVEILIASVVVSILLTILFTLFHLLMGENIAGNVSGMVIGSSLQMRTKLGIRRLTYRLRESIQILSPLPGQMDTELRFRDITNTDIRVRRLPEENKVITERNTGFGWTRETTPIMVTGFSSAPASYPVEIPDCKAIRFTAIGPDTVTVEATLMSENHVGTLLTLVKFRNSSHGY